MIQYAKYLEKSFRTRQEAEVWAKKQKADLKSGELGSAKIDIDFNEKSGEWLAKILMPV